MSDKKFMSSSEFAKHLGYDTRVIDRFVKEGMPVINSKLGKGSGKVSIPVSMAIEWLLEKGKNQ